MAADLREEVSDRVSGVLARHQDLPLQVVVNDVVTDRNVLLVPLEVPDQDAASAGCHVPWGPVTVPCSVLENQVGKRLLHRAHDIGQRLTGVGRRGHPLVEPSPVRRDPRRLFGHRRGPADLLRGPQDVVELELAVVGGERRDQQDLIAMPRLPSDHLGKLHAAPGDLRQALEDVTLAFDQTLRQARGRHFRVRERVPVGSHHTKNRLAVGARPGDRDNHVHRRAQKLVEDVLDAAVPGDRRSLDSHAVPEEDAGQADPRRTRQGTRHQPTAPLGCVSEVAEDPAGELTIRRHEQARAAQVRDDEVLEQRLLRSPVTSALSGP